MENGMDEGGMKWNMAISIFLRGLQIGLNSDWNQFMIEPEMVI